MVTADAEAMHSEDRLAAAGAGMGDGPCGLATRSRGLDARGSTVPGRHRTPVLEICSTAVDPRAAFWDLSARN
jgi:hypothetical protein